MVSPRALQGVPRPVNPASIEEKPRAPEISAVSADVCAPSFNVGFNPIRNPSGQFPRLNRFVLVACTEAGRRQSELRPGPCPDQSPTVAEVAGAAGVADLIDEVLKTPGQAQGLAQGQAEAQLVGFGAAVGVALEHDPGAS